MALCANPKCGKPLSEPGRPLEIDQASEPKRTTCRHCGAVNALRWAGGHAGGPIYYEVIGLADGDEA